MMSESDSSFLEDLDKSDESLVYTGPLGIPDIFVRPSITTNRPFLNKKIMNIGEICSEFEGKDYMCRICHGGNSSGDLLTPCKCKGTIALAHLSCLEIWLNESNRNECELCQYHFRIIREPKYSVFWSIFIFLRYPGEHLKELLVDTLTLIVYTPSTATSTYMLMLLCESLAKSKLKFRQSLMSHAMAFTAVCAINFTYTSWLILTLEKYVDYWREWYKKNCSVKVILSSNKLVPAVSNSPP